MNNFNYFSNTVTVLSIILQEYSQVVSRLQMIIDFNSFLKEFFRLD